MLAGYRGYLQVDAAPAYDDVFAHRDYRSRLLGARPPVLQGGNADGGSGLRAGHLIRGGIDLDYCYRKGDVMISPALVRAYHLGQEIHQPVLGLTTRMSDYLTKHPGRMAYAPDLDPVRTALRSMTTPGGHTISYLDCINITLDSPDWERATRDAHEIYLATAPANRPMVARRYHRKVMKHWLAQHRRIIVAGLKNSAQPSIYAKYKFLADYHDEVVEARRLPSRVLKKTAAGDWR